MQSLCWYKRSRRHAGLRIFAISVILTILTTGFGFGRSVSETKAKIKSLILRKSNINIRKKCGDSSCYSLYSLA